MVDPFCGAATVGTATTVAGGDFLGIEAHPLIVQLAQVKLRVPRAKPTGLLEAAERVGLAPKLPADGEAELVRRCFDIERLEELCGIREAIEEEATWRGHLMWALLGTLRDVASKKVGWPYQRPGQPRRPLIKDPRARFIARAAAMAEDLEKEPLQGSGRALLGDSRSRGIWRNLCRDSKPDACVTSPPYLNNFDYADATRLEVYFLGRASSWRELCDRIRVKMLVASTQQSRVATAARDRRRLEANFPAAAALITPTIDLLAKERLSRDRGKEYDRLVPSYFCGVAAVLGQLKAHGGDNISCAWVVGDSAPYGIYIDTPGIIGTLAESIGFKEQRSQSIRSRGNRWRENGTRHQVALEERLVCFSGQ